MLAAGGMRPADIGTDHAFLPIYLVKNDADCALASDINEGPCERARTNIREHRLQDKITVRCVPGLSGIEEFLPDCVIICGMGGEMIASILDESPYPMTSRCTLVLQPMTMQDALRKYLAENGYEILAETVVFDAGKYYQLIKARYDGKMRTFTDTEYRLGAMNLARAKQNPTPDDIGWLSGVRDAANKRITGREKAVNPDTAGQNADLAMLAVIDQILKGDL